MNTTLGGLPYVTQKRNYINFYGNLLKKIDGEIGRLLDVFYEPSVNNQKRVPRDIANNTWIVSNF